jgi:hypothetical protein
MKKTTYGIIVAVIEGVTVILDHIFSVIWPGRKKWYEP